MSRAMQRAAPAAAALACILAIAACRQDGCVGGDDGHCLPPSACPALRYSCNGAPATLRVTELAGDVARAAGPKALAASGDFLLENDRLRAVLDLPEHPQGLAPTGGTIIDLAPLGSDGGAAGDQTNGISQAAGVLPRDAVHYESWEVIDRHLAPAGAGGGDATAIFVAVVFRGHLEGDRRVTVVTRYELRPCEPGLRVRTDVYNGAADPNTIYLTDGFFWGDHTMLPFVPLAGHGFRFPELDLLDLPAAWREWPFLAARAQAPPEVSYASVPCDHESGAGFNDTTLSAAGVPLVTTLPGDGLHYERFIVAAAGPGLAPAVGEALRVRAMVHGEPPPVTVVGRVVAGGVAVDGRGGRAASLLFYEPAPGDDPDDESRRTPWTEAVPAADGRFSVQLPPDRAYRIQPYAFGRPAGAAASLVVAAAGADAGDVTIERAAHLVATVEATPGRRASYAELVLIPVDRPSAADGAAPSLYGDFVGCNPMLGPPHGGSPACNRALTADGRFDLLVPPGRFYVYATRGPFATIDRAEITVGAGDEVSLSLLAERLSGLLPDGVVSGDFHVHGGASYDSAIPDQDRVVSFLASGVDVIVATDHDVVTTYESTLQALGAAGQITVIPGVEQTPNILWFDVPGERFPKTVGHFNFWPLGFDPLAPRNGAPWDELREPGQMMDDLEALGRYTGAPVRQLNHPFSETKLGRDQGYLRMLKYDPRTPIAPHASFAADALLRRPGSGGGGHANLDWNVQEVMTGASRRDWLRYRTLWFSLLSQGILRAGAANSDSHTLALEKVGYPRNLVFGGHDPSAIDVERLDADVVAGHMVGTNGPVIDATVAVGAGDVHHPDLAPFAASVNATLTVTVTAAPWIPVSEVRVIINGKVARTLDVSATFAAIDHFGSLPGRAQVTVPLSSLLPSRGDAWLVVEAGLEQPTPPDDDGDGLPDLADADLPSRPRAIGDPRFDVEAIAPGVWPTAFTNPFLLNLDGGDWQPPGLP
jgi:hypothetical protein